MRKTNKPPGRAQVFTGAALDDVNTSGKPTRNRTKLFLESTAEQKVFVPPKKARKKKK